MGWHTVVEDLKKFWVFEHPVGSNQFKVLQECSLELQKGLSEVEHKENLMLDKSDKKQVEQQQREAVLRRIEEDNQDRQRAQARKRQAESAAPTSS
ncbi:hypothetical protein COCSUDRAFT_59234 [Coccomyxa subellipsoidea C-169]|uniref:Uncharacterized protein n=1 Tax=Coccomyxa subellipsoidea (strain C-169) TaxID=574566 RepID=I0Z7U8_COCSC|nr:hypothetical protein COCSUDRAFT_59234 [Coccomyxa subellipsoidea C-169]EIE26717.1 hypothetical protein COCSUDRAFT_59234 [Coccomyxa subellipsoidea C-169]|eukprot:XP_005651261.1 hypothetical protein COCSUDRAFT_59234 [Coccomyxa subellipsoidea C-169]